MKLFTAAMVTESSDLTPVATTNEGWLIESPESEPSEGDTVFKKMLALFRQMGEAKGWQVIESISASAMPPGGRTITSVYESIRQRILADLKQSMPVDGVLLQLHGAAMAYGYDDCEGDLLAAIRDVVGKDVPIGVELDPHCHVTKKMMDYATAIILYKTWLHTDIEERAIELFDVIAETIEGKVIPQMALFDCHMIDMYNEAYEPMKSFLNRVIEYEKEQDVLSISPVHGFPMADNPDMGSKMLVITNNDKALAKEIAEKLGREFYQVKGQRSEYLDTETALDLAQTKSEEQNKTISLIDWSDLAGCGFPTDGTQIVRAMLDRGMKSLAVGLLWDPLAVSICADAGVGVELLMRIGGKASCLSGQPLDMRVKIEKIHKDAVVDTWLGAMNLGDVAVVRSGETQLILVSRRIVGYGHDVFRTLGIDTDAKRFLLFKYLRDDDAINVLGSNFDPRSWPFTRVNRPKWPWDDNALEMLEELHA